MAATANGVTTNYVIDPFGLGNVVGQYDATGNLLAHYAYGLGLVSQTTAAGSAYYYAFDAIGSTSVLTNSAGAVVNSYAYLCPGQVAGADFVRPVCRRGSQGTGQFNFAHRSMAA